MVTIAVLLASTACSAPRHVGRVPLCPPSAEQSPTDPSREDRIPAEADKSSPVAPQPARPVAFDSTPAYRTIVEYVEVPVAAPPTAERAEDSWSPSGDAGAWSYETPSRRYHREPFFPVNTALGVGVGAVIGHQSRHRNRGALIGGSVGLMLDLARWLH